MFYSGVDLKNKTRVVKEISRIKKRKIALFILFHPLTFILPPNPPAQLYA